MRVKRSWLQALLGTVAVFSPGGDAIAGSHLWRFNEIFSNADGTVQFIELKECCGSTTENGLNNRWVAGDVSANQYDFTVNIAGNTANKHLLLATSGFAALPGAPAPDFIIEDNFLIFQGDTLRYWTYPAATMTYGTGELPSDGITSLHIGGTTGVNSPTNFSGETGSVDASVVVAAVPAISRWGVPAMVLLLLSAGGVAILQRERLSGRSDTRPRQAG